MKPSNPTLLALLASRSFYVVDVFSFTLADGTVLNYGSGDKDITYSGTTYPSGGTVGPYFQRTGGSRGLCSWKIGVEVDVLSFDVLPGSATVEGFPFLQACKLGIFDGAEMTLYRAFMPTYGDTSAGLVNIFSGRVVEIDCGRSMATFNINSHLELLSQQMPRNLFQSGCLNTLYDGACTLQSSNFRASATCSSASTVNSINSLSTALSPTSGIYELGTISFTSGENDGFKRNVKLYTHGTPSVIVPLVPLPFAPLSGDTFTITQGCNKSLSVCTNTFANSSNFRATDLIPAPETGI